MWGKINANHASKSIFLGTKKTSSELGDQYFCAAEGGIGLVRRLLAGAPPPCWLAPLPRVAYVFSQPRVDGEVVVFYPLHQERRRLRAVGGRGRHDRRLGQTPVMKERGEGAGPHVAVVWPGWGWCERNGGRGGGPDCGDPVAAGTRWGQAPPSRLDAPS